MTIEARFTVYGRHVDDLKEAGMSEALRFFRAHEEAIELVDLEARPVVETTEGEATRWKADVKYKLREEDDDDE